ncbi:MAG: hypothetical protein IKU61_05205 [Clostridia bacterium]|nr:hypothetical protein [Clostridia bacterium]
MRKFHISARMAALGILFILVILFYLVTLVNLQITGLDYYGIISEETNTRYVTITAKRGEIYDRNGKPLVINTENHNISLEYGAMPKGKAQFNEVILNTLSAIENGGGKNNLTTPVFPFDGSYPSYTKNADFFSSPTNVRKFESLFRRLEFDEEPSTEEFINFLRVRYGLATYSRKTGIYTDTDGYSAEEADILMRIRFDMEYMQFSRVEPYTLATNVSLETLTFIKELSINQVIITEEAARTYVYDGYASHILGHIGKIQAENAEYYKDKGYSGDAHVGITGIEKVYEDYLHGSDGTLEIVEDAYGNIISETVVKEPIPGNDVYLTIDIDLQITAEDALADNIVYIHQRAALEKDEFDGEDANSGAVVAADPSTGEILAIASYPTFKLSDYTENYNEYAANELKPLLNRALMGTYAPGSTFKPGVAAAALQEGVISVNTIIVDRGAYDFGDYHPRCWIYLRQNRTHGSQNVVQAIQNSCNYFFYEVGNRLGIKTMNSYGRMLGLGEPTGIELAEKSGILAGPDYSESVGNIWNPGNTLQAAIGQSDNTFTPIQLCMYTGTLINGGTRYRAHLLREVKKYPSGELVKAVEPEILDKIEFKAGILPTIKSAMKDVVESGSAARIFRRYDISVGGKTGTAQVGGKRSDNALFIGFAPYDEPKIAVSVVIEQGANGTDAAYTAKALYDTYLKGEAYVRLENQ